MILNVAKINKQQKKRLLNAKKAVSSIDFNLPIINAQISRLMRYSKKNSEFDLFDV